MVRDVRAHARPAPLDVFISGDYQNAFGAAAWNDALEEIIQYASSPAPCLGTL